MKRIINCFEDWQDFANIVVERWYKSQKPFEIKIKSTTKTQEQLGYFHSEVLPKLTIALSDTGEILNKCEEEAKYYLKVYLNYGKWFEFRGAQVFAPESFAKAKKDMLSKAIDNAIRMCEDRGIWVSPPVTRKPQAK